MTAVFAALLRWTGSELAEADRLIWLRWFLMGHAVFELCWDSLIWQGTRAQLGFAFVALLSICCGLALVKERQVIAIRLFVAFLSVVVVWLFPDVPNHYFLVFFVLLLLSIVDLNKPDEALLGLRASRWVVVIVLFYTGFQKLLYGTYFKAQFLTWTIAHDHRFETFFSLLLPETEIERITSLSGTAGPFSSQSWVLLAIANLTWIFELAAPGFLLWRKSRSISTGLVLLFLLAIEAGAREFLFGSIFINLLLLFPQRNWYRLSLPVTALLYAYLLFPRLGAAGGWW